MGQVLCKTLRIQYGAEENKEKTHKEKQDGVVAVALKGRSGDEKSNLVQRDVRFEVKSNGQKKLGMTQENDRCGYPSTQMCLPLSYVLK